MSTWQMRENVLCWSFIMSKWLSSLPAFLFSLILIIALSLWGYRWIFNYRFSYTYMRDWYDHSQWQIPISPRIMGDAELYQLSAYHLIKGDNPFNLNPETPPAGKYVYGAAILLTNNPYIAALFFYVTSLILFFALTTLVFEEPKKRHIATFLFALSPTFFSQIGQIGLDMTQVMFLLLHVIFLFVLTKSKLHTVWRVFFAVISGIALGLFTASKVGVFSPIIFVMGAWYLWQNKQLRDAVIIAVSTPIAYMGAYLPYFLLGHNIIDWLKAQKWILNFYLSSKIESIPFMALLTTLSGVFMGWWDSIVYVREWTVLWPVSVALLIFFILQRYWKNKKMSLEWKYFFFLSLGLFVLNCFIPFWPRYFMMILPFCILLVTQFFEKKKEKWLLLLLLASLIHFIIYLFPLPNETLKMVQSTWQTSSYGELYSFTDNANQSAISRAEFTRKLRMIDYQLEISEKEMAVPYVFAWPWQNEITREIKINYHTPLGYLYHPMKVTLVREDNKWRMIWKWDNVLPHLEANDEVLMVKDAVRSGDFRSADGIKISEAQPWPYILVTPDKVDDSEALINDLVTLTKEDGPELRYKLFVVSPGHLPIPVNFLLPYYDPTVLERVQANRAVILQPRTTRVYHTAMKGEGILKDAQGVEKGFPNLFEIQGGRIFIRKPSGEEIVIHSAVSKNGEDVTLPRTFKETFGITVDELLKANGKK